MQTVAPRTYTSTSTSSSTMNITPIVLRETTTTRLLFFPVWAYLSDQPLRGGFIFQKKSAHGQWEEVGHQALTTLKKDESYRLNLQSDEVVKLISELNNINEIYSQTGHQYGVQSVQVVPGNVGGIFIQIADPQKRQLMERSIHSLSDEQIENLDFLVKKVKLEKIIERFESNIENDTESFWQNFFQENSEILQHIFTFPLVYLNGETYLGGKNTRGRSGSGGTATDFLFKNSTNGSFGVIEIKTPKTSIIGSQYRGKTGGDDSNTIYSIHQELSGGLVQLENQIYVATDYFKSHLAEDYDEINTLNPCGVLIAGNQTTLNPNQKKSFNLFRKSLGKNQVLTFDEILEKLKLIKEII